MEETDRQTECTQLSSANAPRPPGRAMQGERRAQQAPGSLGPPAHARRTPGPLAATHLPLPLGDIHQHDALWEMLVGDQDLVQLIVN